MTGNYDIIIQKDLDNSLAVCAGFMLVKTSKKMLDFFNKIIRKPISRRLGTPALQMNDVVNRSLEEASQLGTELHGEVHQPWS